MELNRALHVSRPWSNILARLKPNCSKSHTPVPAKKSANINEQYSLIRLQEKHILLCKELIVYWCLDWRMTSHALSVCCYRASQFLCFGSWDGRAFMLAHVNPSEPLVPPPLWNTTAGLAILTDKSLTSQAVQKSHKRSNIVLWLRFWPTVLHRKRQIDVFSLEITSHCHWAAVGDSQANATR